MTDEPKHAPSDPRNVNPPRHDAPDAPTTFSIPPEDMLTVQDADVAAGGNGVGPHEASEESVPVETMEDLGIGPRHPYPTADDAPPPPPPEDAAREHAEDKRKEYPL
jgi:hypothetical protein